VSLTATDIDLDDQEPRLAAHLAVGSPKGAGASGVVLIHGFPSPTRPGPPSRTYHQLGERIADELGWTSLALSLRGCGESEGQFSLDGWIADVDRAITYLCDLGCRGIWLVGSTTGGSLAMIVGASDSRVEGVAVVGARADFDDWAREPERFVEHCRRVLVITDPEHPSDLGAWTAELERHSPINAAAQLSDRSLLVVHGARDRQVPSEEARALAAAHGNAQLRVLDGGNHRLRHDPRFVALLLGWLERQTPVI